MDVDLKAFYRERDAIMNQPDEDLNEYRKRMLMGKIHLTQVSSVPSFASFTEGNSAPVMMNATKNNDTILMSLDGQSNPGNASHGSLSVPGETSNSRILRGGSSSYFESRSLACINSVSTAQEIIEEATHDFSRVIECPRQEPTTIGFLDRAAGSREVLRGKNVEEMCEVAVRNSRVGVKRRSSLIQMTSPAKRQRSDDTGPIWSDFSIEQTSTHKSLSQIEALPSLQGDESPQQIQGTVGGEAERPSEILSFATSPERRPQKPSSSGQSSPIGSFSHILTRSLSSDLRQQEQVSTEPALVLNTPQGQPFDGAAVPNSKQSDGGTRRSHHDEDDPPTSPIEDLSAHDFLPPAAVNMPRKGIAASGSTRLCLEVKERVARHVAMKRRDKVIPLGSKGTEKDLSRLSVSKDQFQEDISSSQISSAASSHASSSSRASDIERPSKPKATRRSQAPLKAQKTKTTKKEKQAPISPVEYAQQLLDRVETAGKRKSSAIKFLEGKNIFYIGGDMQFAGERTRGRMELIVKHGGNLIPAYDPAIVTHIVTDAPKPPTLRALGYKRLGEIPDYIPTVKWGWVLSAIGRTGRLDKEDIEAKMTEELWLHAAFSERMDTTPDRSKSMAQVSRGDRSTGGGTSGAPNRIIVTSHQIRSVPFASNGPNLESCSGGTTPPHNSLFPSSLQSFDDKGEGRPLASSGALDARQARADPLEEFYAEARAARENSWSRFGECDESDNDIDPFIDDTTPRASLPRKKRGWTCDSKEPQAKACPNQDIIEKLQELQELHKAKPGDEDHWRAYSYSKSVRALRGYPKRIQSYSEARSIRGVGEKTALKIMEILQTGDLRRINYEKTDDIEVTRLYQGIYGVGQSTAFKWYSAGCRTLEDLRNHKGGVRLNSVQLIGLQYYDDINSRMPRNEAKAIFELIKPIALSLDSKLFVEIMGSYRRGKEDCGDIDILITRPTDDDQTHLGILGQLLPILHKAGIITEDLAIPEDLRDLECVYRGLCRLPQPGSRRRRIDFLTVPWQSRGAALLYYTGDDIFNRAMRLKASKMGYSLNQRGLYSGIVRDPKDSRVKLNEGNIVASETEEEIFRILNVPWQEPHERVRG